MPGETSDCHVGRGPIPVAGTAGRTAGRVAFLPTAAAKGQWLPHTHVLGTHVQSWQGQACPQEHKGPVGQAVPLGLGLCCSSLSFSPRECLLFLQEAHPDAARLGRCPSLLPRPHPPEFESLDNLSISPQEARSLCPSPLKPRSASEPGIQ